MKKLIVKINSEGLKIKLRHTQKKLNRLNNQLFDMMNQKAPIDKLISFENRVVKVREKCNLLDKRLENSILSCVDD